MYFLETSVNRSLITLVISIRKKLIPPLPPNEFNLHIVNGITDLPDHFRNENSVLYKRRLRSSEIKCSLAHDKALRIFLNSVNDWAMVLEDDAVLQTSSACLIYSLNYFMGSCTNQDPTFVHLGIRNRCHRLFAKHKKYSAEGFALWVYLGGLYTPWNAHAYLINRPMAKEILRNKKILISKKKFPVADDWFSIIFKFSPNRIFYCQPRFFSQNKKLVSNVQTSSNIVVIRLPRKFVSILRYNLYKFFAQMRSFWL